MGTPGRDPVASGQGAATTAVGQERRTGTCVGTSYGVIIVVIVYVSTDRTLALLHLAIGIVPFSLLGHHLYRPHVSSNS